MIIIALTRAASLQVLLDFSTTLESVSFGRVVLDDCSGRAFDTYQQQLANLKLSFPITDHRMVRQQERDPGTYVSRYRIIGTHGASSIHSTGIIGQ